MTAAAVPKEGDGTLTITHRSHRRHVPAANILIEGRRYFERCASHTQTNKHKSVRKGKVSVAVVVMVVMIGSREAKEDVEARSTERGRKDGRKEGGVKVQEREQLVLRRLCCQWWGNNVVLCMGVVVIELWWNMVVWCLFK